MFLINVCVRVRESVCVWLVVTLPSLRSSPGIGGKGFLETRKEEQKQTATQAESFNLFIVVFVNISTIRSL